MVRAELEHKRSTAFSTHDDQQRAEVEANRARENADNWRAQYERDQEELERLAAQLKEMHSRSAEAQKTASGIEQSSTGVRGAKKKRNEAEAKLHTKKRRAEKKLTTVFVVYASAYYRFIIARAPADGYTCFRVGVSRGVAAWARPGAGWAAQVPMRRAASPPQRACRLERLRTASPTQRACRR
jgi:multidrug resistance efflux pump